MNAPRIVGVLIVVVLLVGLAWLLAERGSLLVVLATLLACFGVSATVVLAIHLLVYGEWPWN